MIHVTVPLFDGPLDGLLAAAERSALDMTAIALADVVSQCLAAVRRECSEDASAFAHLVSVAARLMQLKSAALLPRPAPPPPLPFDEQELAADLAELISQYRRFKLAAAEFRGREADVLRSFPRLAPPPISSPSAPLPGNVTLDRLLAVVAEALRRRLPDPPDEPPRLSITVRERLAALEEALERLGRVGFTDFIGASRTRIEVVIGFMAVLELIKSGRAAAEQAEPFGDIVIVGQSMAGAAAD